MTLTLSQDQADGLKALIQTLVPVASITTTSVPAGTQPPVGTALIDEDFSRYADVAAFRTAYGIAADPGYCADLFSFESDAVVAKRVLRYNFPAGNTRAPHWFVNLPSKTAHVVARWSSRWSPGFHIACPNISGSGYKDPAFGWVGADSRSGVDFSNGSLFDLSVEIKQPSTGAQYGPETIQHIGQVGTEWTDGKWYDYALEVATLDSLHIGARFWRSLHGQPLVLQTGVGSTSIPTGWVILPITLSGVTAPLVDRFLLGENFNQVRDVAMSRWVGGLRLEAIA